MILLRTRHFAIKYQYARKCSRPFERIELLSITKLTKHHKIRVRSMNHLKFNSTFYLQFHLVMYFVWIDRATFACKCPEMAESYMAISYIKRCHLGSFTRERSSVNPNKIHCQYTLYVWCGCSFIICLVH